MVEVNIYKVIDKEDIFMSFFGLEDSVFNADTIHKIFDKHPNEKEFKFNINCDGGLVSEGLRIYDVLRTSGKTIHCNIENACHSMAVCVLLAAPKENRTANPNARALIHEVRTFPFADMTAEDLRTLASEMDTEQDAILDIYAERTGYDRAKLEALMKEEKQRTVQELKNYGFISKINTYNTNQKKNKMSKKKQDVLNSANSFLAKLKNLLNPIVNYDFTDDDDNVLFSTESEDDTLEVGMSASPDGTFELPDGRSVTIAEGVITEIVEPNDGNEEEVENLRNALVEAETIITDLRNQVKSTYNARGRVNQPGKANNNKTVDEYKNEMRERREKLKGGK